MGACIEALLVEDNCSDAQLVETVVGLANPKQPTLLHHVDRFKDAVETLSTTDFDVVLLDLKLPDGEGTELIGQLKRVAPQVPVVVITGSGDQDTEAQAFSAGADDFMVKSNIFSPQRFAKLGYIDIGNLLVQRLYHVIEQARIVETLQTDAQKINKANSKPPLSTPSPLTAPRYSQTNAELDPGENFAQLTLYSVGITLMSTLGLLNMQSGRYSQAEKLLEGALEIRKRLLGPTHPDVIVSLHNLATLYDNQGRYLEAENLYYESLKLCEEVFGTDSALTRKFRRHALVISRMNQALDRASQQP